MSQDLLEEAIKALSINNVFMRGFKASQDESYDPTIGDHLPIIQSKFSPVTVTTSTVENENADTFYVVRVVLETGVRFIEKDDGSKLTDDEIKDEDQVLNFMKAEIIATFVAEYILTKADTDNKAIEEFAKKNAGFHVWPYWREFVQNTCNRLSLPEVVLPMYRAPK